MRCGLWTGPLALVWLPPEKQKYSQTVLPAIEPPAARIRVTTVIDIRHIALHRRGAVHHRHAGEADIVFERDLLAFELAGGSTLDVGLDIPGAMPVLFRSRTAAREPRIGDGRQLVRHPV